MNIFILSRGKLKVLKVSNVKHKVFSVLPQTIIFHNTVRAHINGDNKIVGFDRENGNQMINW